ncbi:hypothetical protein LCGC14_3123030, partial [marine sediment metagenome]
INSYFTDDFDGTTITWNNQPATGDFQELTVVPAIGYQNVDLGDPYSYYKLVEASGEGWFYSTEYSSNNPYIRHYLSKKYQDFVGGYVYMQTDESETLSIINAPYGTNYTIHEGEYFEIELESSASHIDMKLYSGGVLNITLTVLSGNTNLNKRTIGVGIPSNVTFDQIEFIGIDMEDTEYFIGYDIFVGGYEDVELYYNMFIDPDGKDYLMAQVGDYLLRIWDEVVVVNDIIISSVFIEGINITLTYDLLTRNYIPVIKWNLKIYHYAYELSTIEIFNATDSTLVESTTMGYNEILDFYLVNGSYIVNWTNGENGVVTTYNIILDIDRILVLSTIYYNLYF